MLSRKKLKIVESITSIGAAAFFFGFLSSIIPLWVGGILLLAAGWIVYIRMCRCPHCGKHLRKGVSSASDKAVCPHCGEDVIIKD